MCLIDSPAAVARTRSLLCSFALLLCSSCGLDDASVFDQLVLSAQLRADSHAGVRTVNGELSVELEYVVDVASDCSRGNELAVLADGRGLNRIARGDAVYEPYGSWRCAFPAFVGAVESPAGKERLRIAVVGNSGRAEMAVGATDFIPQLTADYNPTLSTIELSLLPEGYEWKGISRANLYGTASQGEQVLVRTFLPGEPDSHWSKNTVTVALPLGVPVPERAEVGAGFSRMATECVGAHQCGWEILGTVTADVSTRSP